MHHDDHRGAGRADTKRATAIVEMNAGQMVEDVRLAVNGRAKVDFYGRMGGGVPTEEEILGKRRKLEQDSINSTAVARRNGAS